MSLGNSTCVQSHFLYAIKSVYSSAVKVGRYIADMEDLRNRYITPYGKDMDIVVFQVPHKTAAMSAEAAIHKKLKAAGYHLTGELFDEACINLFLSYAATLCLNHVDIRETRNTKRKREEKEDRKAQRARQRFQKNEQALQFKRDREATMEKALDALIEEDCIVGNERHVNAGRFRRAVIKKMGQDVQQVALRKAMAKRDCPYKSIWIQGHTIKAYSGLELAKPSTV